MRTLEYNPETGRQIDIGEEEDKLLVRTTIDKALLHRQLDRNKQEYNAISHKGYKAALGKKNMWRAASIPNFIVMKWKNEEGIDVFKDEDWPKVQEKLNSAEYLFLRTSPGKI